MSKKLVIPYLSITFAVMGLICFALSLFKFIICYFAIGFLILSAGLAIGCVVTGACCTYKEEHK